MVSTRHVLNAAETDTLTQYFELVFSVQISKHPKINIQFWNDKWQKILSLVFGETDQKFKIKTRANQVKSKSSKFLKRKTILFFWAHWQIFVLVLSIKIQKEAVTDWDTWRRWAFAPANHRAPFHRHRKCRGGGGSDYRKWAAVSVPSLEKSVSSSLMAFQSVLRLYSEAQTHFRLMNTLCQ